MFDTVAIEREAALSTNPTTGAVTRAFDSVYSGKGRVRARDASPALTTGSLVVFTADEVHIPTTAGPVLVGDRVTVTACPTNPTVAGDVYRVVRLHDGALTTAQRLGVERWT